MRIREDDPRRPPVVALLREHLEEMIRISPPGSMHALDPDALTGPALTFWTAGEGDEVWGCGALRELDPAHGEIKAMRTAAAYRRRGVAARLLEHLVAEAAARGYRRLSLETGAEAEFLPAHALYLRHGFVPCGPFGDYRDDPHSRFFTLEIPSRDS